MEEPVLTGGSSSSGTTSGGTEASSTFVNARVESIERSLCLGRQNKPRCKPKPEDVFPNGPKWERIGDRVIRISKSTNEPEEVWPEVCQKMLHKERNLVIKEVKEFRGRDEIIATTAEAPLEGIRPTGSSTGEGAWPGAPAAQFVAPAGTQKEVVRHIVEFCTSENSKLGDKRYSKNGCSVMQCSLRDGVIINNGLERAPDGVLKPGCLLWASMPCTGGSPWQHINRHTLGGLDKLDARIKDWRKIWTSFKTVARECIKHSGHIAVGWPSGCDYWRYHIVRNFFDELQFEKINFDGCALRLRSDRNDPIRKPWGVATNSGHVFRAFATYLCSGRDKHPYHEPCAGKYTKRTESDTWPFIDVLHKAWRDSHLEIQRGIESCEARYFRKLNRKIIPAMPCQTVTMTSTDTQLTAHRPRSEHHPAYNAMVARLLISKEVNNNPKALQAILDEGQKLLKQGVWDIITVSERRDVMTDAGRLYKKVHFCSELPENDPDRKFKGRCVVQGNDVKDESSHAAIFQELSSSPAIQEAAKSVDAYGYIQGNGTQQCDAQQAYVQTELGGVETWISLPKILRPASW